MPEQVQLVTLAAGKTARLESLKNRLKGHIDRLREYRQALITAAVTGQLDVSAEASEAT